MNAALQAETLKLRTTRTTGVLVAAMLGLVLLSICLHSLGLSKTELTQTPNQFRVFTEGGESVGAVFAALLGALSITAELRHGTIRPTLLGIPKRQSVMVAKATSSIAVGFTMGFVATGAAAGLGSALLDARGIRIHLGVANYAQLVAGGGAAAALWSCIGLGVGAVTRNQVGTIVGIFIWLQIVENLLTDSAPSFVRFMPGSLGAAVAGGRTATLSSGLLALVLLVAYAAAALTLGIRQTLTSDFA